MSSELTHMHERMAQVRGRLAAAEAEIKALKEENEKLRGNLNFCIGHVDLIERAMLGATKFACGLCGAGTDDDHDASCPLVLSRQYLRELAAPTQGENE